MRISNIIFASSKIKLLSFCSCFKMVLFQLDVYQQIDNVGVCLRVCIFTARGWKATKLRTEWKPKLFLYLFLIQLDISDIFYFFLFFVKILRFFFLANVFKSCQGFAKNFTIRKNVITEIFLNYEMAVVLKKILGEMWKKIENIIFIFGLLMTVSSF